MARRLRIEYPGALYHVMNRGLDRRRLFLGEQDTGRFVENLSAAVDMYQVQIHAYALLPNHYHLLVQTSQANLGAFMQALQTRYGVYFNLKHRRSGHVYQGPYKAVLVEEDNYLLKLSRYVHLNPVRTSEYKAMPVREVIKALRMYRWSSYRGYIRMEKRKEWVSYGLLDAQVASLFGKQRGGHRKYVETGLAEDDEEFKEAAGRGGWVLGSLEFVEEMKERYRRKVEAEVRRPEDVASRRERQLLSADVILRAVADGLGIAEEDVMRRRGGGGHRGVAARMLLKYGGMTQRDAAEVLGVTTGAAVSLRLKTLDQDLRSNRVLARSLRGIEKILEARQAL